MSAARSTAGSTILAIACSLAGIVVAFLAEPYARSSDLEMIQLLAVVLVSLRFGVRDSIVACVAGILAFDFVFIPPKFAFAWTDAKSGLTFIAMLVVSAVISRLTERLRDEERHARMAAVRGETLYALNVELSDAEDSRQVTAVTLRHLEKLYGEGKVKILLRNAAGGFDGKIQEIDRELVERAWSRREFTRGTRYDGAHIWVPLAGIHGVLGLIGVRHPEGFPPDSEQALLLAACANQFAVATERMQLDQAIRRTELETETERQKNSLLSAISHDLKTPLATMIAAGTTLIGRRGELDPGATDALLATIVGEGERLTRLIENLLSISRLESPTIELRRSPEAIEEIVAVAVSRVSSRLSNRIAVEVDPDLPLVFAEPLLVEQILVNLLENAGRYAGPEARIAISAAPGEDAIAVRVADDGPGIPETERDKVFEKFFRGRTATANDGGAGLGLTICRAIVRAHGGRIAILQAEGRGTVVEFTLPLAKATLPEPAEDPAVVESRAS